MDGVSGLLNLSDVTRNFLGVLGGQRPPLGAARHHPRLRQHSRGCARRSDRRSDSATRSKTTRFRLLAEKLKAREAATSRSRPASIPKSSAPHHSHRQPPDRFIHPHPTQFSRASDERLKG